MQGFVFFWLASTYPETAEDNQPCYCHNKVGNEGHENYYIHGIVTEITHTLCSFIHNYLYGLTFMGFSSL